MNRNNNLYLIIGVLLVITAALGIRLYQEEHKREKVEISIGGSGISVEKK